MCRSYTALDGSIHGTSHAYGALHAVVHGRPNGRLSTVVWYPDMDRPEGWRDLGTPPGVTVRGTIGVQSQDYPAAAIAVHVVVLGDDGQLWKVTLPREGAPTWARVGSPGIAVVAGSLTKYDMVHQPGITAVVATADGHLWSVPVT